MIAANINFLSCQNTIDHIMVMGCVINFETFRFKINKHFQNKHENFVKKWLLKKQIINCWNMLSHWKSLVLPKTLTQPIIQNVLSRPMSSFFDSSKSILLIEVKHESEIISWLQKVPPSYGNLSQWLVTKAKWEVDLKVC